ncbi:MAG: phosphate ABC transporter permease PstA [Gammaproteobacteria bacterium]|nr:phosphate ABC transporter permease PstA [Gammaproteobacteria bacterium]
MSVNNTKVGWFRSGTPWVWMSASAVSISLVMVFGLLILIAARGLGYFWPADLVAMDYTERDGTEIRVMGEQRETSLVPLERLLDAGFHLEGHQGDVERHLLKIGNRDLYGIDFRSVIEPGVKNRTTPEGVIAIERREWGNFYGFLNEVKEAGNVIAEGDAAHAALVTRLERALILHDEIKHIEKIEIGAINYQLERLRLKQRKLELNNAFDAQHEQEIAAERAEEEKRYEVLQKKLMDLYDQMNRDSLTAVSVDGRQVEVNLAKVVRIFYPNEMTVGDKLQHYFMKVWEFLSDEPREANTEGGIFPAIFGTVLMVILMAILVTPFGVVAAIYLREYATQGPVTRVIRIAVNNLAGVPSVVYGVFGLGFFVYFLGGNIDALFFPEAGPAPTFGTPGILWSSLTLAILTLPVVIVATEEGLSRIPLAVREGSLALGATKAETLWRIVIPMASPALMTGLILAVARAAGEVAPLMLVGVVKLAPSMPLDGNFPFLHLDRKFMHLGFHIYDVGFQSPNVEAARPLVYATALLLVLVIVILNLAAIHIRNRLREKYQSV